MDQKLAQLANLSQKDKAPAFLSLLSEVLSRPDQTTLAPHLHTLVDTVVNQESVGLVVGRQVLSELVKALGESSIPDVELRKAIVQDTLAIAQTRINSYEEQVSRARRRHSSDKANLRAVGKWAALTTCRHPRIRGGVE